MREVLHTFKEILIVLIWALCIALLFGTILQIHLAGKVAEYKEASKLISHSYTEQGFLINKEQALIYNSWLAYWKELDRIPIIGFFIPEPIKELNPIILERPKLKSN
jgi:hypothetical protein